MHEDPLAQTVTPGELTLVAASGLTDAGKGKVPCKKDVNTAPAIQLTASNLISLDSPFLSEPLVDAGDGADPEANLEHSVISNQTATTTDPYVSASASLHTSQELASGARFEELWNACGEFRARGWSEDAVEAVMRRLQGLGMQMDVLPAGDVPFEGICALMTPSAVVSDRRAFHR